MARSNKVSEERARWRSTVARIAGSAPWMNAKNVEHYRAKVFKSGNSLALRLPAGLGLSAGEEMDLRVEDGEFYSFEPVGRAARKFNIQKVWGSGSGLRFLKPEDRLLEERPLITRPAEEGERE